MFVLSNVLKYCTEIGTLPEVEIGKVIVKLKSNGYSIGLNAEDVWAFAERA